MYKPDDPRILVLDLIPRSICEVRVAAVIADRHGIFAWGWNSAGAGLGLHAEAHAIKRANKRRLDGAIIYVASVRSRNDKVIYSKPCLDCRHLINKWDLQVVFRDAEGNWIYD